MSPEQVALEQASDMARMEAGTLTIEEAEERETAYRFEARGMRSKRRGSSARALVGV
jgi:hypothetical protein